MPDAPDLEPFRCDVETDRDTVRLRPVGELDLATVPVVEDRLTELWAGDFAHLILDLRGVRFLDSTGVRLVWSRHRQNAADGPRFSVIAGPPAVQRVLEIAGIANELNYRPSEQSSASEQGFSGKDGSTSASRCGNNHG